MNNPESKEELLSKIVTLIDEKEGEEALKYIDTLEKNYGKELSFKERHACGYYRVCAVGYLGEHSAFQKALDQYNDAYRELFRIARAYNHLTKEHFPPSLSEYAEEYIKAMDVIWWPISHYAMNLTGGADNVADVFTNRYHTDDPDAFKRSHSRREALESVRHEAEDENGKVRLFKALSAAGFLISSFGLLNDKVDVGQVESGLAYLKEGELLGEEINIDPLDFSRNLFDQAKLYQLIDKKEESKEYYQKVIDLLKEGTRGKKEIPKEKVKLDTKESSELSDPLYEMAKKGLALLT